MTATPDQLIFCLVVLATTYYRYFRWGGATEREAGIMTAMLFLVLLEDLTPTQSA